MPRVRSLRSDHGSDQQEVESADVGESLRAVLTSGAKCFSWRLFPGLCNTHGEKVLKGINENGWLTRELVFGEEVVEKIFISSWKKEIMP